MISLSRRFCFEFVERTRPANRADSHALVGARLPPCQTAPARLGSALGFCAWGRYFRRLMDARLWARDSSGTCGLMSALALKVIALREHNVAGLGRPSRSSTSALFSGPSPLSWANRAIASVSLRPAHRSRRTKGCLSEGVRIISLSGIFAALALPVQP